MASREFEDARGGRWMVWDVYPTLAERRRNQAGRPPGNRERRRTGERRIHIRPNMVAGWLAFESHNGERRRLAPIPDGWNRADLELLRAWCTAAESAPPARRLLE